MYLTNVKEKMLWRNDKTSAMMLLTKTPVGISSAAHNHPDANQWVMGVSGEVETSTGKRHTIEGAFSFVPKGVLHGARKVTKKSLAYVYFDGPRIKQFATDQ
jgi:quercetin dioxygenase-like cupin family protein